MPDTEPIQEPAGGEEPALSFLYIVGRVNQGILREMRLRLGPIGLSAQEYTALSVLGARPGLSNAQLARRSLVTPQSMIEILSKLESRGLVTRTPAADHGRVLHARLTAEGEQLLAQADREIGEFQAGLLDQIPARERQALLDTMREVMRRLAMGNPP